GAESGRHGIICSRRCDMEVPDDRRPSAAPERSRGGRRIPADGAEQRGRAGRRVPRRGRRRTAGRGEAPARRLHDRPPRPHRLRAGAGRGTARRPPLHRADHRGGRRGRPSVERELAAARRVAPFCTAPIIAADAEADPPYTVSEYIEGPSLRTLVTERGALTGGELTRLAIGTATALAAIHEAGVVHRDFKPAN